MQYSILLYHNESYKNSVKYNFISLFYDIVSSFNDIVFNENQGNTIFLKIQKINFEKTSQGTTLVLVKKTT